MHAGMREGAVWVCSQVVIAGHPYSELPSFFFIPVLIYGYPQNIGGDPARCKFLGFHSGPAGGGEAGLAGGGAGEFAAGGGEVRGGEVVAGIETDAAEVPGTLADVIAGMEKDAAREPGQPGRRVGRRRGPTEDMHL